MVVFLGDKKGGDMRFTQWIVAHLLLIGSVLTLGTVTANAAGNTGCISAADMQDIASHFNQFQNLAGKEYCFDGSQTSNLLETIVFMRSTNFAPSMPKSNDQLFSGAFANDWWGYFTGRINEFSVQDDCPKGVGAFVYAFGGNTMYVCPMMLTANFTSLDRSSIFMHEARHIDGYPHVTCSHGPRAGLGGACDQRISDGGSYAVTVETYAQLAKYAPDLHPALRAYARAASVVYADEAFEETTRVDREDDFLLMTNKKEFYRLPADGSTTLERWGDSPALGHIVMRARFSILYPEDKSLPAKYVFQHNEGDLAQQAGDLAMEYNSQTPAQRAELIDMHLGAQWSVRVYRDHLVFSCNPRSADTQTVSLGGQVPASVIYPNGLDRAAKSVNVITQSGAVLEVGCNDSGNGYLKDASLVLDQAYKRVVRSGKQVLGLSKDGRLFAINGATSVPLQTSVDGQIFELSPVQAYGFYDKN